MHQPSHFSETPRSVVNLKMTSAKRYVALDAVGFVTQVCYDICLILIYITWVRFDGRSSGLYRVFLPTFCISVCVVECKPFLCVGDAFQVIPSKKRRYKKDNAWFLLWEIV